LKLIVTRSVGVDNVDMEYCKSKGIRFMNIRYSNHNVVHHTIAFILFYSRQLSQSFSKVKSGIFCHEDIDCLDLGIRTLGIVGYGRIGKEVAQIADTLGLKVIAYDRKYNHGDFIDGFELYDLEDLIQISDIISLHCDANPTSVGIINEETIGQMKDGVA
jgi:D-lactate dehydrogenase